MGIRGKEDPWNSIGSGAITGAVLAARGNNHNLTVLECAGNACVAKPCASWGFKSCYVVFELFVF